MQRIKNLPTSLVSSAAVGLVEISGRAQCNEPKRSPLSGTPCVFWKVKGEMPGMPWIYLHSAESDTPFYVEDDTGRMQIVPDGAKIDIPHDRSYCGYIAEHGNIIPLPATIDECAIRYIKSLSEKERKKFMDCKEEEIRLYEYYIGVNDLLYVLGTASPIKGATGPVNHETLEIRRGLFNRIMYISDTPEGKIIEEYSRWRYLPVIGLVCSTLGLFGILRMVEVMGDLFIQNLFFIVYAIVMMLIIIGISSKRFSW